MLKKIRYYAGYTLFPLIYLGNLLPQLKCCFINTWYSTKLECQVYKEGFDK